MPERRMDRIIVITGLSGSGKSVALEALEDAGFYCVDNLPVILLKKFLELPVEQGAELSGLAFVMDLRERGFVDAFPAIYHDLRESGYVVEVWFMEADVGVIVRRYSQTRRHHPLSNDRPLMDAIRLEIKRLASIRELACRVIDTSAYNIHELKSLIFELAGESVRMPAMCINILSFGFKHGIPPEADIVMDVRFIKNPYFVSGLRPLDGRSSAVRRFVLEKNETMLFLKRFFELIDFLIPEYEKENRAYLTIAFGCTGGIHRSVAVAEAIFDHLRSPERNIKLIHRDVDLED